ncbi:MAG: acyl-CoA dehydrogenase family protein [Ilumatobacteraceae bacterium]
MTFRITEEQVQLSALVADILDKHGDARRAYDKGPSRDPELLTRLAELGLVGLALDEPLGGGGTFVDEVLVAEQVGRAAAMVPVVGLGITTGVLDALAAPQSPEALTVANALTAGGYVIGAVSASSGFGTGFAVSRDGADWRLTGTADDLLDGAAADAFVIPVVGEAVEWFLAPRDAPGMTVVDQPSLDPTQRLGAVTAAGADVRHLGTTSTATLDDLVQRAWVLLAAQATGAAGRGLDITVEYATTRHAFGQPIGRFQAIKHRTADGLVLLENARSATYNAAWALDEQRADREMAARMAKAVATENAVRLLHDAIQSHGGIGFTWEYDLHLLLRRAKSAQLALGDPDHHFTALGAAVLAPALEQVGGTP